MKLNNLTGFVAVAGGAAALYMFWKYGGATDARRDLSRVTGGRVTAPTAPLPIGERDNGAPTFGVRNPWANDPIFQPYPYGAPVMTTMPVHTPAAPLTTATFGVGLN